jgi:hypothetical protein
VAIGAVELQLVTFDCYLAPQNPTHAHLHKMIVGLFRGAERLVITRTGAQQFNKFVPAMLDPQAREAYKVYMAVSAAEIEMLVARNKPAAPTPAPRINPDKDDFPDVAEKMQQAVDSRLAEGYAQLCLDHADD